MTPYTNPGLVTLVISDRRDQLLRRYGARRASRGASSGASTRTNGRPAFSRPLRRHAACAASGR